MTRRYDYNLSGELISFTQTEGLKYSEYLYSYDDSGNRIRLEKNGVEQPETITYEYNKANQLVSSTSTISGKTEYAYDANGSLISEQTDGEEEVTYEYTVEQRLSAVREGGTLLMAASYDGDGNRVFQVSRKEVEQYVEKDNVSNSQDAKDSHESSKDNTQSPVEDDKGLTETVQAEQAATKTYYEKVYADPAETIFWYGFGQGIMHFVGNINSALSAYLSDWFCHAWDFITGQYELVLHSEGEYVNGYSKDDIEAMRRAGLSEEDVAEILGIEVAEDSKSVVEYTESGSATQPTSDEKTSASESVVIPENPDEKTRVDYELTYYVNDVNTENTQVLMEYGKRDELKSVYTYGNERISAETIADTYNPKTDDFETDYYLYDGRGSVAQVLNSSEIVESYTYDPFGNVTSGAPEFDSFYGYNAEDTNPVTGLQYLRARYYDTEDGRFSVADTYLGDVSEPLTLNRYAYTANNPVMQTDPSGHIAGWIVAGLVILGGTLLLTGCGKKETKKDEKKENAKNPKEEVEQTVKDMQPNIEEVEQIDAEINAYISGDKKVEKGKSLKQLIDELNERRAKLCETLKKQQKLIVDYNNANPNKTVEIPALPNLNKSPSELVTKEQLTEIGFSNVSDAMTNELNEVLLKYNIVKTEQIYHFLGQCLHEGNLGLTERNWSKENALEDEYEIDKQYFNNKYSERADLGNLGGDDGYLFRGAGYIQLTGRYNYEKFAEYIGDDKIVSQGADYVAENYAWEAAGYFWTQENINQIIDEGGLSKEVSYKVSQEVNRYDKQSFDIRYEYYEKVSEVMQ